MDLVRHESKVKLGRAYGPPVFSLTSWPLAWQLELGIPCTDLAPGHPLQAGRGWTRSRSWSTFAALQLCSVDSGFHL